MFTYEIWWLFMFVYETLNFFENIKNSPSLVVVFVLTLGVIFVNGWTDAPNAIATCIATKAISPKKAVLMSAFFNFLGVFVMTLFNAKVAFTIKNMVNFEGNSHGAIFALCASLAAIIIWAVSAWFFGIPTSESHALVAGLTGAAVALQNNLSGINGKQWALVIYGLVLSTFFGFAIGYAITKLMEFLLKDTDRNKTHKFFKWAQVFGGASMSFMHGAQDGQKFMGVMLLGISLTEGQNSAINTSPPLWMLILCSVVMSVGTSVGGYKIIKSIGMDMVKLKDYQAFSADISSALCLLLSTVFGFPASTTHTKTSAIMGVGASKRLSAVNLKVVKELLLTWILTFPGCAIIGYFLAKLFIHIF